MDIYPEDFQPDYCTQIQQVRGVLEGVTRTPWSFIGAMCGSVPAAFVSLYATPGVPLDMLFASGFGATLGYVCGFVVDRRHLSKQRTRRVTAQEISLISKGLTATPPPRTLGDLAKMVSASKSIPDALRIEYLRLASELVSMQPFQDTSVEASLRCAFRDIGTGVERLPGQPAGDLLLDAETFNEEATRLAAEAAQESDPIVAASLGRQSAAQRQRAEAIGRNAALARRNQVLRSEMTGHIKALKTMLGASALGDGGEGYDLAALAANVQQVASEARSLAEAKTELAVALGVGQESRGSVVPEEAQLNALKGQR